MACPDHPHGRGENFHHEPPRARLSGPSPRAWGKPWSCAGVLGLDGTIPTGVGKTLHQSGDNGGDWDHPHGRGENHRPEADGLNGFGPSPRAWGKPSPYREGSAVLGTIPTGVGKTKKEIT